jgi:DNA-binding transcriptional LysR family regulator
MDLHRIAVFHLVATAGGYRKAARAASYPITAPALHQQIRKLEQTLGTTLLRRTGKDVMVPTAAGQHLLREVAPFLENLPVVLRQLRSGAFGGTLTIQAESLPIRHLLPQLLLQLRRRRPQAEIHLQEVANPDAEALRRGRADVLIAHLPEVPPDLATLQVGELHPFLVLPREAAPRRKAPALRELGELPFLAYPVGSRQHGLQLQALALHGASPRHSLHIDSADAIFGFVESGLGWSLVPALGSKGPQGRRLRAFPLDRPKVTFPVHLAWHARALPNPLLEAFLACAGKAEA